MKPNGPIPTQVYKCTPLYYQAFFPGGKSISKRRFQDSVGSEYFKNTFNVSLRIIQYPAYGLDPKVYLGKKTLSGTEAQDLAKSLYKKAIDPMFFVYVLNTVASKAAELNSHVAKIQLGNLGRASIGAALESGSIKRSDIGEDFYAFHKRPIRERLAILEKLKVLVFKNVEPQATEGEKGQLELKIG